MKIILFFFSSTVCTPCDAGTTFPLAVPRVAPQPPLAQQPAFFEIFHHESAKAKANANAKDKDDANAKDNVNYFSTSSSSSSNSNSTP